MVFRVLCLYMACSSERERLDVMDGVSVAGRITDLL